jgi:hypothetical protein
MGNYHVPFCRAVGEVTLLLTLIILVAGGHSETQNGCGEKVRLSVKKAHFKEASTHQKFTQLSLFG